MRPTNKNYFFVLTQRYHALNSGSDKHPWLRGLQFTLQTLLIHSALFNLPTLVEPTESAKLLDDLMVVSSQLDVQSGKFYPPAILRILGTEERTINTKEIDNEHLETNVNTQTQLIPYLYLKCVTAEC